MIPAERSHLFAAARSHPGMSGKNNEDSYTISAFQAPGKDARGKTKAMPALLAVVSDGIGGHRAGEVAAEIAVKTIREVIAASDPAQPAQALRQAIVQAGQLIFSQAENDADRKGMGATCACAWILGDRLYTASVGDSRIYLVRGGAIRQVSVDHTWVQEAIDHGALSPEEARMHPNAHVIRRYLGSKQPVIPDLRLRLRQGESDEQAEANQGLRLLPGDQLLLCSDGLTDLVDEAEILAALKSYPQEKALDELVELANTRGGHDNITVVSLQMPADAATVPAPAPARRGRWRWACLGVPALLLLGAVLLGGYWLYGYLTSPDATPTITPTGTRLPLVTQPAFLTSATPDGTVTPTRTPLQAAPTGTRTLRPTGSPASLATLTPWPTNTVNP